MTGLPTTLLLGYGNVDRQDDGVAWHILRVLAGRLGLQLSAEPEDAAWEAGAADLMFALQLTPEMAEDLARYDRVCFFDAHTGQVPEDVHVEDLRGEFQASPFTHHLTPASCLALAEALHGRRPAARLISVRGHAFGFEHALSPETAALARQAADLAWEWLQT